MAKKHPEPPLGVAVMKKGEEAVKAELEKQTARRLERMKERGGGDGLPCRLVERHLNRAFGENVVRPSYDPKAEGDCYFDIQYTEPSQREIILKDLPSLGKASVHFKEGYLDEGDIPMKASDEKLVMKLVDESKTCAPHYWYEFIHRRFQNAGRIDAHIEGCNTADLIRLMEKLGY